MNSSLTRCLGVLVFLTMVASLQAGELPAAEKDKIEKLIKHVGELKGAVFVRNGSEYETSSAVRFLRGKWDTHKAEVKSAKDFIDKVATSSGTSGKPYLIRFKDGGEKKSGEYLHSVLKKLKK